MIAAKINQVAWKSLHGLLISTQSILLSNCMMTSCKGNNFCFNFVRAIHRINTMFLTKSYWICRRMCPRWETKPKISARTMLYPFAWKQQKRLRKSKSHTIFFISYLTTPPFPFKPRRLPSFLCTFRVAWQSLLIAFIVQSATKLRSFINGLFT